MQVSEAARRTQRASGGDLQRIPFGSDVQAVAEIVARDGGLILTGVLSADEVREINADLDPLLSALPTGNFGSEVSSVTKRAPADEKTYTGGQTKHLQHCYKRSKVYREKVLGSRVLAEYLAAIMPGAVGAHSVYASVVIEIFPGEAAQGLHRDGDHYFGSIGLNNAKSVCYLANSLLALSDITEDMGATRVIPGSHLWDDFSQFGSPEHTIPATMKAGDMLFYNGKVSHGGGANLTADRPRRVLATAFSFPFVMGEEAWPFTVSPEEVRTYPRQVQQMLGFRSKAHHGEDPGFFWRVETMPLEKHLGL